MTTNHQLDRLETTLFHLNELMQRYQEIAQKRFKINGVDVEILRFLDTEGDQKMKDIGDHVRVKLSNLTNIVDNLETLKLVRRVNSKTDRRSIFVNITPKGKKLIADYNAFLRELTMRMTNNMQADEFGIMLDGLERISQVTMEEDVA
jgi:DNA-binding MarR family transcriptional regulator